MSDEATLAALGLSYRAALEEIKNAQASANLTIDRAGAAVRIVGNAADGSTNTLVANALSGLADAALAVEQALAQLVQAATDVEQFISDKGI
jgi:hypothetical protein